MTAATGIRCGRTARRRSGASYGEKNAERLAQRNGCYRDRTWETRAGTVELRMLRARHGVGHGVNSELGGLGRRRARQSGEWSVRNCARDPPRHICRARRPVDMWTTQARCPQTHRIKKQKQASI
jgi:hypothetical protein